MSNVPAGAPLTSRRMSAATRFAFMPSETWPILPSDRSSRRPASIPSVDKAVSTWSVGQSWIRNPARVGPLAADGSSPRRATLSAKESRAPSAV